MGKFLSNLTSEIKLSKCLHNQLSHALSHNWEVLASITNQAPSIAHQVHQLPIRNHQSSAKPIELMKPLSIKAINRILIVP